MNNHKDFWDLTNKPQTKIKLKILKDYLSAWAKIFANQKWYNKIYYIDCFAGRGKYHDNGINDTIDGSPLIALNIARQIKEKYKKEMICYFIEENKLVFDELVNFTAPYKNEGLKLLNLKGDINNLIEKILLEIPRGAPVFFFIDPEGINIKRETIEKILAIHNIKELLINYIHKGVERCLAFGIKSEEDLPLHIHKRAVGNLKRIKDFFGSDWDLLNTNEKSNLRTYLNVILEYNKSALEKNQLGAKVIDICYNKNRNKYYLIFLSRNKTANNIIEDIYRKVKVDGTLFKNLPAKEIKKMFQDSFDI